MQIQKWYEKKLNHLNNQENWNIIVKKKFYNFPSLGFFGQQILLRKSQGSFNCILCWNENYSESDSGD